MKRSTSLILCIIFFIGTISITMGLVSADKKDYIKYVEFNVCYNALKKASEIDINTYNTAKHISWIDILSYLGAKYGGDFKKYKSTDIDNLVKRINNGETLEAITENMKYFSYYKEAYGAVLKEYIGKYSVQTKSGDKSVFEQKYGLKAFSPIAEGFYYSHYDDFGVSRSYGYKREHLGHDLMALTGTPVIAIEGGIVEAVGWNKYGGWRIGIRSFDKKRYYYYAHLRQNRPYHGDIHYGKVVSAGDVIGYVGRTGYSNTENTNGIKESHLHFGVQLIFDECQKEGNNEIWINLYSLTKFLYQNRAKVYRDPLTKEFYTLK